MDRFAKIYCNSGVYSIEVDARPFAEVERDGLRVEAGETNELDLLLEVGVRLEGVVRDAEGELLQGATVIATRRNTVVGLARWIEPEHAKSDAAGRFVITGMRPGELRLEAKAKGIGHARLELGERADGERLSELELQLAGEQLRGIVTWPGGEAAVGAEVSAIPSMNRWGRRVRVDCDEAGNFVLEGLSGGPYTVVARALPEDRAELDFLVLREALVRGEVSMPDGAPAGVKARVEARLSGGGTERAKCDEEGRFELDDIAPGEVVIVATLEGLLESAPSELELAPAEERDGLQLSLRGGARIVGEVDPSVPDAASRKILASPVDSFEFHSTVCDEEGQFEIGGLSAGTWFVGFDWRASGGGGEDWVRAYQRREEQIVALEENETAHVVIGCPHSLQVRVSGRVTAQGEARADYIVYVFAMEKREAQPAAGVSVRLMDKEGPPLRIWTEEKSDHTGAFRFGDVGAGELTVVAETGEGLRAEESVSVSSGGRVGVVLRLGR